MTALSIAHRADPSDRAYELAADLEQMLVDLGFTNLPLRLMAKTLDADMKARDKIYVAMENALAAAVQIAMIHGAGDEEMKHVHKLWSEGDVS